MVKGAGLKIDFCKSPRLRDFGVLIGSIEGGEYINGLTRPSQHNCPLYIWCFLLIIRPGNSTDTTETSLMKTYHAPPLASAGLFASAVAHSTNY